MSVFLARKTGSALVWKSFQLAAIKVIFLARTLVLARLLVPEDFGLLAISLIAFDFLSSITDLGMTPALVQHHDPDERKYNVAWTINLTRAALIAITVFLAAPFIASLFAEPRAAILIRVMALRPVLNAAASIKVAELTRNLRFQKLTFLYLPEALANTLVSIVLAPQFGVWALVAGVLAGPLVFGVMSYIFAPHRPQIVFDSRAAQVLIRFGRWIFAISVISVVGRSALQAVISRQLGVTELGLYYLAGKLAFIPAEIAAEVVGAVAFPLYSRLQDDRQQLARAFRAIFSMVSALLLPVCALLIALAPALVTHVLGANWTGTTRLIQLLALVNIVGLYGDIVSPLLKGMGQPHKLAIIEALQSALLIVLIWLFTGPFGVLGAALAWLGAVGAAQLVSAHFVRHLLERPFMGLARSLLMIVAVSTLGGALAWAVTMALPGIAGLIIAAIGGGAFVAGALLILDRAFDFGWMRGVRMAFPQIAVFTGRPVVDT